MSFGSAVVSSSASVTQQRQQLAQTTKQRSPASASVAEYAGNFLTPGRPAPQIWKEIMTDVAQDPVVSANVIFDILNEPDSYGLTWDGTQLDGQGLSYWYHQVMAMGYAINPGASPQAA